MCDRTFSMLRASGLIAMVVYMWMWPTTTWPQDLRSGVIRLRTEAERVCQINDGTNRIPAIEDALITALQGKKDERSVFVSMRNRAIEGLAGGQDNCREVMAGLLFEAFALPGAGPVRCETKPGSAQWSRPLTGGDTWRFWAVLQAPEGGKFDKETAAPYLLPSPGSSPFIVPQHDQVEIQEGFIRMNVHMRNSSPSTQIVTFELRAQATFLDQSRCAAR